MATNHNDITKCSICLEILAVPRDLPCLHTFCEICIESYINANISKGTKDLSFKCPVCRTTVPASREDCSVKEWVAQLPVNQLIVGLLEKRKIERAEKNCMSCERLANVSKASYVCVECSDALCADCHQYHKANRFTSKHKTVPIEKISEVEKSLTFFRNECQEHCEEVRLFCVDHDSPCCSICVSVDHRTCKQVVTIKQAAKGFLHSDMSKNLTKTLTSILHDADTIIEFNKTCCENLDKQYDEAVKGIDDYFDKLKNKIEEIRQVKKDEISKSLCENKDKAETNVVILENLRKKIVNEQEILKTSFEKATDVQAMIETKRIDSRKNDSLKTVAQVVGNSFNIRLEFTPKVAVEEVVTILEQKYKIEFVRSSCFLELDTCCYMFERKRSVGSGYPIIDCFFNTTSNIVTVQDYKGGYNNVVQIFDRNGNKIIQFTPSSVSSYGTMNETAAAGVNENEMAFISTYGSQIQYLNYSGGQITWVSINATGVTGLAFGPDKETAAVGFPNRIQIVKRFYTNVTSFTATNPKHLNIDQKSRLFYTEGNVIRCKTLDGKDCFTITNPKITNIDGMAMDEKGNIFISSTLANTVSRVSTDGSIISDILTAKDGLLQPSLISISGNGDVCCVVNQSTRLLIFHRV